MADLESTFISTKSDADWSWHQARLHFKEADSEFHDVVKGLENPVDVEQRPAFESLVRAVIGQQLSTKAAHTIWCRFVALYDGELNPEVVVQEAAEVHRSVGVSGQKHGYIMDLCRHYLADPASFDAVGQCTDQEVITSWTKVKGLGPWTVQMHLMFQLSRPDVFPVDDLGVRRAMEKGLSIPKDSPKTVYAKRALVWSPFRTAASRLLWESLNAQPK